MIAAYESRTHPLGWVALYIDDCGLVERAQLTDDAGNVLDSWPKTRRSYLSLLDEFWGIVRG